MKRAASDDWQCLLALKIGTAVFLLAVSKGEPRYTFNLDSRPPAQLDVFSFIKERPRPFPSGRFNLDSRFNPYAQT